ncbi:MAG: NAD(P)-dependent oxidoreductase [Silvibacterium sp.]
MNVVLYGATGMIGSRILNELIARGHKVTVVARNPAKVSSTVNVTVLKGDVLDAESVASTAKGVDAVISAYGPGPDAPQALMEESTRALIAGVKKAGVRRFLMVGGAGSLLVAPGVDLIDSGHVPEEWRAIAIAHRGALAIPKGSDLDWTSVSPAAFIQPGERTGKFRLGGDSLIADEQGNSKISAEDFAVALVDELEQPNHVRRRFTLAY